MMVKPPSFRKRRHRKRRYTLQRPEAPSNAHSKVFRTMRHRELERGLNGIQTKHSKFHLVALMLMLMSLFGVGVSNFNDGTLTAFIQVEIWQLIVLCFWFLFCSVMLSAFSDSIYFGAILWCSVYWPLLAMASTLLFRGSTDLDQRTWIFVGLLVAEIMTILMSFTLHYLYPRWIRSEWFEQNISSERFFSVQVLSGWTMTYKTGFACWRHRHTCMYQGAFDDQGLPHGYGQWTDDSAETLTGYWRHGQPVAPFRARQYGTADAMRSVPMVVYMATDDTINANKFIPSNDLPPRSGVAGVECNVQGVFYHHYPVVEFICPPKEKSLSDHLRFMKQMDANIPNNRITIEASSPRGIEISGHVYQSTGLAYADDLESINIRIERSEGHLSGALSRDNSEFKSSMPYSDRLGVANQDLVLVERDNSSTVNGSNEEDDDGEDDDDDFDVSEESWRRQSLSTHLVVDKWIGNHQKEALVFFAGFNSTATKTAKNIGQFLAMTKVSDHVIPIVYAWPGGQALTYRYSAEMATSKRNKEMLHELLEGLAAEGIRQVHFLSHSMGVQPLLNAFSDEDDGTRSPSSRLFQLEPSFGGKRQRSNGELMLCKSITMLNPDFPLDAFIDRAFLTIRRVCSHITVIGDVSDGALFYSQFTNGLFEYCGHGQPKLLQGPTPPETDKNGKRKFRYRRVFGKDIRSLYFPLKVVASERSIEECSEVDKRLIFRQRVPTVVLSDDRHHERNWLDLDVIDTTQLDANIMGLRHSGFNLNPILLKDLEELILTGRRASERSALLYREGNIFSYCHVPAYISL